MRYDATVQFVKRGPDYLDENTGNYEEFQPIKDPKKASIMDTTTDTLLLVYGAIRQGSYTIQLQNHYKKPFDYIEVDGRKYSVDYRRRLRRKEVFVVSEVQ